jgi:hypothetical protein
MESETANPSPKIVGLMQALGIALYVSAFASVPTFAERFALLRDFDPGLPFGPILFLLAFIISATICSSLMFGYPLFLLVRGEREKAFRIVLWSIAWLAATFSLFFSVALLVTS